MSDDRLQRIEEKLDRCLMELTGHVAEDKAVHKDVEALKASAIVTKSALDQQRGALSLLTIVSLMGGVIVAYLEMVRSTGGH